MSPRAKGEPGGSPRRASPSAQRPPVRVRAEDDASVRALAAERGLDYTDALHLALERGVSVVLAEGTRPAREALALATLSLASASGERARSVGVILRLGAGHLETAGLVYSSPAGLVPELREAWVAVCEAIRLGSVGQDEWRDDAPWRPTRAGDWESVLATLLVERDWDAIERTARKLEADARG